MKEEENYKTVVTRNTTTKTDGTCSVSESVETLHVVDLRTGEVKSIKT